MTLVWIVVFVVVLAYWLRGDERDQTKRNGNGSRRDDDGYPVPRTEEEAWHRLVALCHGDVEGAERLVEYELERGAASRRSAITLAIRRLLDDRNR